MNQTLCGSDSHDLKSNSLLYQNTETKHNLRVCNLINVN